MKLEAVGEISWSSVAWCWWCYPCGRIWNWQITVKLGISCIIYIHPSVMIVDIRLFPMQKKKKTYFPFGLTIREKYKQKKVPFPPAIKKLFIVFLVVSLSFQENILYLRPNRNREQWERTVDVFFFCLSICGRRGKNFFFLSRNEVWYLSCLQYRRYTLTLIPKRILLKSSRFFSLSYVRSALEIIWNSENWFFPSLPLL